MVEMVGTVIVGLVIGFLIESVRVLIQMWGAPEAVITAEMSETDEEKIEETQDIIKSYFGEDAVDTVKRLSTNKEKIDTVYDFAQALAECYGLDCTIDVVIDEKEKCGFYDFDSNSAKFNIYALTTDINSDTYDFWVKETIDTVVHELRHAVQFKAINEEGFWNVDEERRTQWANNMAPGNYISASVDMRAYASQPVEADASTFAARAMEGVN